MKDSVTLLDANIAKTVYPDSFPDKMPSRLEKAGIEPGDACKLAFQHKESRETEAMWVDVVGVCRRTQEYVGYLHNKPLGQLAGELRQGADVKFHVHNVLSIWKEAHALCDVTV
jgi:hypothetical protein